jgi:aminoacrylate hydrolase
MPILKLEDGGSIHYETRGEGPPLLFLNNLGGLGAFWSQLHRPGYENVTHDYRGAGRSSLEAADTSVERFAGDVIALMDHLGIARAAIAGHSMGGAVGQVLAIDHPDRVERLMICASWPGRDPYFDLLFHARARVLAELGPAEYVRQTNLFGRPPRWLRDHPEDAAQPSDEFVAKMVASPACLLKRIAALRAFDRRGQHHLIRCPVMIAGAEDDMVTPVHLSRELAAAIPHSKLDIADWGGHFYPVIRPEIFIRQLTEFLDQEPHARR